MRLRLFMLVALGAALAVSAGAAHGTALRASANSQSFPDSVGEDPNAPDITSIDVSNDDAGDITFKVNVSNRPQFTQDMTFLLYLDTDQNVQTGDSQDEGADYAIELDPGEVSLFQFKNSDYVVAPSQTSLTYSYATTGPTIHVSAHDLGGTKAFDFAVVAISGITTDASGNPDFSASHSDAAPDPGHGFYSYQVLTKLILRPTGFTTAPSPAKAGKPFAASLAATENDTDGPVTSGTITCTATLGGKKLRATHKLANGVASCFWHLPKQDKGKTLYGSISVTVRGVTLEKGFRARVT